MLLPLSSADMLHVCPVHCQTGTIVSLCVLIADIAGDVIRLATDLRCCDMRESGENVGRVFCSCSICRRNTPREMKQAGESGYRLAGKCEMVDTSRARTMCCSCCVEAHSAVSLTHTSHSAT